MNQHPGDRAKWAWEKVSQVRKNERGSKVESRYGTLARKLPAMLHTSGLGQTLAFLYSKRTDGNKKKTGDGLLLEHLRERLQAVFGGLFESGEVVDAVLKLTPTRYRLASHEIRESALWLKRFAEGKLDQEKD